MSSYPPPRRIPNAPIFNPLLYGVVSGGDFLTLTQADSRYLKLTGGNVNGQVTVNNELTTQELIVSDDGTETNPSIRYSSGATNTGWYHINNSWYFSRLGYTMFRLGNYIELRQYTKLIDGGVFGPALCFLNDSTTGLYRGGTNQLDFSVNGNNTFSLKGSDTYVYGDLHIPSGASNGYVLTSNGSGKGTWQAPTTGGIIALDDGSAASPSLHFTNDTNTGFYRNGTADEFSISLGGFEAVRFSFTQTIFYTIPLLVNNAPITANSVSGNISLDHNSSTNLATLNWSASAGFRITESLSNVRMTMTSSLTTLNTSLQVYDLQGGSSINSKNYIRLFGGSGVQKFIRFRSGGSPFAEAGITFSGYDTNNFFMYNSGSGFSINYKNDPEINSLDLGTNLFYLHGDGRFEFNNASGDIKHQIHPTNGYYNYGSSTSTFIRLYFDGTHGYLALPTGSSNNIYIGQSGGTRLVYNQATTYPSVNNTMGLGQNSLRYTTIYLINAPNVSSSETKKKDIGVCCGLRFINQLQPKTYRYIFDGDNEPLRYGLMAEDVKQVLDENGMTFRGLTEEQDEDGNTDYGIGYQEFIAPLIKSVQELSIQNEQQQTEIDTLKNELNELKTLVQSLITPTTQ